MFNKSYVLKNPVDLLSVMKLEFLLHETRPFIIIMNNPVTGQRYCINYINDHRNREGNVEFESSGGMHNA